MLLIAAALGACGTQPQAFTTSTPVEPLPSSKPSIPIKPQPPENWPYRWLNETPCRPPCWEGIIPGQTTAEEAVGVLSISPVIAAAEVVTNPLMPDRGYVLWEWVDRGEGGEAIFHAQTPSSPVYAIHPNLPTTFRFGDVIQVYGEPSHVMARSYYGPDVGSGIFYDLSIVYLSQGFILYDGKGGKPVLSADTRFSGVTFFVPGDEGLEAALGGTDPYLTWITPWQGMKDFDFYCRDEAGKPCP